MAETTDAETIDLKYTLYKGSMQRAGDLHRARLRSHRFVSMRIYSNDAMQRTRVF